MLNRLILFPQMDVHFTVFQGAKQEAIRESNRRSRVQSSFRAIQPRHT